MTIKENLALAYMRADRNTNMFSKITRKDENIFKDFINLKRFLVEGLYVYSDEFSSSYVSNLILELTAELGGEKS